jgi:hypothetical protein
MDAKKSNSVLPRRIVLPLGNAIIFGLLLWLANVASTWLVVAVFVLWAWYVYRLFFVGHARVLFLFLTFVGVSLLFALHVSAGGWQLLGFAALAGLMYVFIGAATVLSAQYKVYASIVYYAAVFLASSYIAARAPLGGVVSVVILWVLYVLMFKDYASFIIGERTRRITVWAMVMSLVAVQLLWVSLFLSIGFLGSAALVLVFWVAGIDIFLRFFEGTLSRTALYKDIGFFAAFSLMALMLVYIAG